MTRRVVLSKNADAYVTREVAYLRRHSIRGAKRFRAIVDMVRRNLSRFDELGGALDAPPLPNLRRLVAGDYLFDYLPGNPVVIVTIRHGRQQPEEWESSHLPDDE
jgi:plasmid stabilization system protein ParE